MKNGNIEHKDDWAEIPKTLYDELLKYNDSEY